MKYHSISVKAELARKAPFVTTWYSEEEKLDDDDDDSSNGAKLETSVVDIPADSYLIGVNMYQCGNLPLS